MSISDVIDRQYRLLPADLAGKPRRVIVRSVSVEGVESVTPLLYFEGVGRPLALDANQRIEMAHIARSTVLADWVGAALVLQPVRDHGSERIRLLPADGSLHVPAFAAAEEFDSATPKRSPLATLLRIAGALLVITLLLAAIWLMENNANLNSLLDVLMP